MILQALKSGWRGLTWLHDFKTEHHYLGRYSVEKLCAFHEYQRKTSPLRVFAVIVLTPVPSILTLWAMNVLPLRDPRESMSKQGVAFLRSIVSHGVMTYSFLLAGKQAMGLDTKHSKYTHEVVVRISLCVCVTLESIWVIVALGWRYPQPCREFIGVLIWSVLLVVYNYLLAGEELARVWGQLKRYIPVVGTQMVVFYFLLFLTVGFAAVSTNAQIAMILTFPVMKVGIKRALWKFACELDDISADVTICMVEISGALYQTVCMQYVQNNLMVLLIMLMDFVQAALEAATYMSHDYIGEDKNTLETAVKIVEGALFSGTPEQCGAQWQSTTEEDTKTDSVLSGVRIASPPHTRPVIKPLSSLHNAAFELDPDHESLQDNFARILRRGKSWYRRRQRHASRRTKRESGSNSQQKYLHHEPQETFGTNHTGSPAVAQSDSDSNDPGDTIRTGRTRLPMEFDRVDVIEDSGSVDKMHGSDLPMAAPTVYLPRGSTSSDGAAAGSRYPPKRKKLKKESIRTVVPSLASAYRRRNGGSVVTDPRILSNAVSSKINPDELAVLEAPRTAPNEVFCGFPTPSSGTGIVIDDILIRRKDQARVLQQTMQLLFSAEVLLFVEYMEVFIPVMYACCIGGLWEMPTAKYNVVLMNLTRADVTREILTSFLYALVEMVSFLAIYVFIKHKYGISAFYQLAFVLETYSMTLQGKLIGCFITVLNSFSMHQGIDLTFKFDWDALLGERDPGAS